MKVLPIESVDGRISVTFRLYPTGVHLRRAIRRIFPGDVVDPKSIGYHVCKGRVSNIFLVEKGNTWRDSLLHECVHAADYMIAYKPRGVARTEFRAYFSQGLHDCFLKWAVNGFPDPHTLDFDGCLNSLSQAFDPAFSADTTQR